MIQDENPMENQEQNSESNENLQNSDSNNQFADNSPKYGFERSNSELIWLAQKVNEVRHELKQFIVGQDQMVELLMI